ncbi:MAG: Lrp/AsnC family transcriptional regulator [Proteobacteria bacterium]|nr:Lrp/AsnC family transcriptional regulator [Pseudomonadota bacterium]
MSKKLAKKSPRASAPARVPLDALDRKILLALIDNARATNVEIAKKAGLSEAPCLRRIRQLEARGVIQGYRAQLAPDAVGIGFVAFVTLVLDYITASTAEQFYKEIRAIPEIMACYIVSGGYDAVLHVAAADSQSYSNIVFDRLRRIPGVKDVRTSFVMRTIKEGVGYPLID